MVPTEDQLVLVAINIALAKSSMTTTTLRTYFHTVNKKDETQALAMGVPYTVVPSCGYKRCRAL
jgi:hypothetical protein